MAPIAREEVTCEVLMMRFQAGDRSAFTVLVRRHKTPIYNFILRLVRMDLTLLSVDPNVTTIVEGTIMAVVVMLGGLLAMRGRR